MVTSTAGEREETSFFENSIYLERRLGQNTAVVANSWVEVNYDTYEGWRGEVTFAAKRVVHETSGGTVVAVQGGALWASHPYGGCSEGGGELRLLAGRGFGETGFANIEAATRAFEGGCQSERLDLTIGYRPSENWLAMGQVFVDAPREGEEIVRAQASLVHFRPSGRAIQVGLRGRVDGGAQEAAIVISYWGRPSGQSSRRSR